MFYEITGKNICLQCWRPGFDPWVRKIPWRRKWQPTPVLLPGESHGGRSLLGYSPWDHKESDTTEWLHFHFIVDLPCVNFRCTAVKIHNILRQYFKESKLMPLQKNSTVEKNKGNQLQPFVWFMTLPCYARGVFRWAHSFQSQLGVVCRLTLSCKHIKQCRILSIVKNWTIGKAECRRTDAFKLRCWSRFLRVLGQQGDQTSQA